MVIIYKRILTSLVRVVDVGGVESSAVHGPGFVFDMVTPGIDAPQAAAKI
jgi:hypothetical protein